MSKKSLAFGIGHIKVDKLTEALEVASTELWKEALEFEKKGDDKNASLRAVTSLTLKNLGLVIRDAAEAS